MFSRIKQFFLSDRSEEGSRFLAKEKRRLMAAIEEMKRE